MPTKRARKATQENPFEALLLDRLQVAVVGLDADWKIRTWNAAATQLLGWTAGEAAGSMLADLLRSPDSLRDALAALRQVESAQVSGAFATKDGRQIDLTVQVSALRGEDGALLGAAVTASAPALAPAEGHAQGEQRFASGQNYTGVEEKLRMELLVFQGLSTASQNLIAAVDKQFRFVLFNPAYAAAFKKLFGKEVRLGANVQELLVSMPNDQSRLRNFWARALKGETVRATNVFGDPRHDRKVIDALYHPIKDPDGEIIGVGFAANDVTEQMRLQEALLDSNAHFQALASASFEGVVFSEGDNIIDLNEQLASMLGYDAEEMIGKPVLNFVAPEDHHLVEAFLKGGGNETLEIHLLCKDDCHILAESRGRLIFYQDRTVRVSTVRDVTAQRAALEALRESEARYFTLFNNRHSPMLLIEPATGKIVDANPAASLFYGWGQDKLLEMTVADLNTEPPERVRENIVRAIASQTGQRFSFQHRLASGEIRDVEVQSGPIRIAGSDYLLSVITDVTERKRAERALRESEQRFRMAVENIPDVVTLYDRELRIQYINSATERITGRQPSDLIGLRDDQIWPPDICEIYLPTLTEAFATGQTSTIDTLLMMDDGGLRSLTIVYVPILNEQGQVFEVMGITHDNTDRIQAEEALRESIGLLRAIARNIPNGGVLVVDPRLRVAVMEGSLWARLGIDNEEAVGRLLGEVLQGETLRSIEDSLRRAFAGETPDSEMEFNQRTVFAQYVALLDDYDRPLNAMVLALDVTEGKAVELALRESERRFRTSVESLMDGFAILSAVRKDGQIVNFRYEYMNEAGRRMATHPDEPVGKTLLEVLPDQKSSGMFDRYLHLMETGEPVEAEDIEYEEMPAGRRHLRTFEARAIKLGDGFVVTWRDITARKETEAKLVSYAEKLERSNKELEQFAFVASHDLQEPLRKIRMFGSSLRKKLGSDLSGEADDYLKRMSVSADRMQTMINGLLDLSRVNRRGLPYTQVDLRQVAEEVLSDLEARVIASKGRVALGELPVIEADALQIRQLFQNLIANALKFHRQDVAPEVGISILPQGARAENVTIEVADNGIGFEAEYAERIFQPFQRLHGRSEFEGTGIGLSICQRIVDRHHGSIKVHSTPGQGSVFSITLPVKQPKEV